MSRTSRAVGALGFAFWVAGAPELASAEAPVGSFEISLGGPQAIWLPGGVDVNLFCQLRLAKVEEIEACDFQAQIDGTGRLQGHASRSGWEDGVFVTRAGPIRGRRASWGRLDYGSISYDVELSGEANDAGAISEREARIRFTLTVDDRERLYPPTWVLHMCTQGEGCGGYFGVSFAPPTQVDGGWKLALEIESADDGKLGGVATADFNDGSQCSFAIRGTYSARSDVARLDLSPTNAECAGTRLRLRDVRVDGVLSATLQYSLFGTRGVVAVESSAEALH